MSKNAICAGFSARLGEAMTQAGFYSSRSKSGVCIQTLTRLTQHSRQICRKYLSGEALPDPQLLVKLAGALNVSPGWLLFGEQNIQARHEEDIRISKPLLDYILKHPGFPQDIHNETSSHFLLQLIDEISHLEGNETQLKRIIDLAFASANQFRGQKCN